MLLLVIDIGIAVKKIVTMPQKYVLPESTCSLLPFSDETARAAQSSAIVPARICIGNRTCMLLFPLNSSRWFARNIVSYPRYFWNFIDDSIGNFF